MLAGITIILCASHGCTCTCRDGQDPNCDICFVVYEMGLYKYFVMSTSAVDFKALNRLYTSEMKGRSEIQTHCVYTRISRCRINLMNVNQRFSSLFETDCSINQYGDKRFQWTQNPIPSQTLLIHVSNPSKYLVGF